MGKKPVVKLRVFRGETLNYNANGTVKNHNHLVSLTHNDASWYLYMKNIKINDFCDVKVEKVFENVDGEYKEITDFKEISKEVDLAFNGSKIITLTPQQEIDLLKKELKEFKALMGKSKENEDKKAESLQKESKEDATKEYIEKVGKRPFGTWDAETIKEKQKEFLISK
jgi:hypothetical protein